MSTRKPERPGKSPLSVEQVHGKGDSCSLFGQVPDNCWTLQLLHTATLQKSNAKSCISLKQTLIARCLLRENMNARITTKPLNVAFKQFQRLPVWPMIDPNQGRHLSETNPNKDQIVLTSRLM